MTKNHPRYTARLDREGCDDVLLVEDRATGATLACRRFWRDGLTDAGWNELAAEVTRVLDWLNAHAEAWLTRRGGDS